MIETVCVSLVYIGTRSQLCVFVRSNNYYYASIVVKAYILFFNFQKIPNTNISNLELFMITDYN